MYCNCPAAYAGEAKQCWNNWRFHGLVHCGYTGWVSTDAIARHVSYSWASGFQSMTKGIKTSAALKRQPSAFDHCGTIKADIYPFIFFNNCRQTSIQLDNDLQRCYLSNACHVLPKQNQWQASDTSLSRALSLDICRQMPASSSTSPICSSACWALSRSTAFLTYNKHQSILHTSYVNYKMSTDI